MNHKSLALILPLIALNAYAMQKSPSGTPFAPSVTASGSVARTQQSGGVTEFNMDVMPGTINPAERCVQLARMLEATKDLPEKRVRQALANLQKKSPDQHKALMTKVNSETVSRAGDVSQETGQAIARAVINMLVQGESMWKKIAGGGITVSGVIALTLGILNIVQLAMGGDSDGASVTPVP